VSRLPTERAKEVSRRDTVTNFRQRLVGLKSFVRPEEFLFKGSMQTSPEGAFANALAMFDAWCAGHQGHCVSMAVCGAGLVCWVLPEGVAPVSSQELLRRAGVEFVQVFSNDVDRWTVVASSDKRLPMAVAMPVAVIDALQRMARSRSVTIRRMRPWWVPGLRRLAGQHRESDSVVVAREAEYATVLQLRAGRVTRLLSPSFAPTDAALDEFIAEAGMTGTRRLLRMEFA